MKSLHSDFDMHSSERFIAEIYASSYIVHHLEKYSHENKYFFFRCYCLSFIRVNVINRINRNLINICVNFAQKHALEYNERKIKFMSIEPAATLKNRYVRNVELNGKILELVKTEKYLGFIVNDSFNNDDYIKN